MLMWKSKCIPLKNWMAFKINISSQHSYMILSKIFFLKNKIFTFLKNLTFHRIVWRAKHSLFKRIHHHHYFIIIINNYNLLNIDYISGALLWNYIHYLIKFSDSSELVLLLFPKHREKVTCQ